MNYDTLSIKKDKLDTHRPLNLDIVRNLDDWFRIELTYTSNALEGNTLSRRETALVVEKGLTVGGKTLKEHLEATNHAHALDWIRTLVNRSVVSITQADILSIHSTILRGIDDENAGYYRRVPVRISGSTVVLPNPLKVPDKMHECITWIQESKGLHPVQCAAQAHYDLVTIHPFIDGNGRTARLLMNLILMMQGYPPAIIRKNERLAYIGALEKAQLGGSDDDYFRLIATCVNRSLDIYLGAIEGLPGPSEPTDDFLLKIGELASAVGETVPTIRHWTKEGLLQVAETTASGYQLYSPDMKNRCKKIQQLKEKRFTLAQIKEM
jgi:Fic family protein